MLQVIFEFQSAICALTGMDVSNASLYDGATACAEAALMTMRCKKEATNIVIARSLHPHYQHVVEQYLNTHSIEIRWIPTCRLPHRHKRSSQTDRRQHRSGIVFLSKLLRNHRSDRRHCLPREKNRSPHYCLGKPPCLRPIRSAGELGADIAIGEAQPFGLSLSYGGPYLGYIACKEELLRQLPGRIVGETKDSQGRRGFVLTLQAREQHIRREKATSNICTNQALAALAALIAILWYGKVGIQKLALTNYQRCAYLKQGLAAIPGVTTFGGNDHFNEFPVSYGKPVDVVQKVFRKHHIEPGVDLGKYHPKFDKFILVAVTEMKSKSDLDRYIAVAKEII